MKTRPYLTVPVAIQRLFPTLQAQGDSLAKPYVEMLDPHHPEPHQGLHLLVSIYPLDLPSSRGPIVVPRSPPEPASVPRPRQRSSDVVSLPPCVPQRAFPLRADSPRPSLRKRPGLTSSTTVLLICVLAVFLFLLAGALLFSDPLNHLAQAHLLQVQEKTLVAEQRARDLALEETVAQRMNDVALALDRLRSSQAQLTTEVEQLLGQSVQAAIAAPPVHVRRALITSQSLLYAWTDLVNAQVSPAQFTAWEQALAAIRSHLQQHTISESHSFDLSQSLNCIRERQRAVDKVDLDAFRVIFSPDGSPGRHAIAASERRSVQ